MKIPPVQYVKSTENSPKSYKAPSHTHVQEEDMYKNKKIQQGRMQVQR